MVIQLKERQSLIVQVKRETTPTPYLLTVLPKQHWKWQKHNTDKSKHSGCPVDSQRGIHAGGKMGKGRRNDEADKSVSSQSAVSVDAINIDQIHDTRHKNQDDSSANEEAGEHLCWPGYGWTGCPSEPEQTCEQ